MDVVKIAIIFFTVISAFVFCHSIKCNDCKTESTKISKPGFYRHEMTVVDISENCMIVGVRGTVRHWYNIYRWYSYYQYGVVTIYEYMSNSWSKTFEIPWLKHLSAVAIDRNHMALISSNGSYGLMAVSVFIHVNNLWVNKTIISLPDNMNYYSLEIQNGYLIIGASNYHNTSIYVYEYIDGEWTLSDDIHNISDCNKHSAVAMYGSFIIIGCPSYHVNSGIVYVFKRSKRKWVQEDQLTSSDRKWYSYFGNDVAIYGSVLAVGRYGDNTKGYCAGAVIIYKLVNNKWLEETKLMASDGSPYDYFGWSVSLNRNYLIVGSKGNDENGHDTGASYLYNHVTDKWVEQVKLISSDGSISQSLGTAVTINGNHIAVGTAQYYGNRNISVYIYNLNYMRSVSRYNESVKISKSGFYRHDVTVFDIHTKYMVIGISGSTRYKSSYFNYYGNNYYHYQEREYTNVTIYEYIDGTWIPIFERSLRMKTLSSVAIDSNHMATISSNGSEGSVTLSVFTHINKTWYKESLVQLPNNMRNYSLEIQNNYLIIGASNYHNTSIYIYEYIDGEWTLSDDINNISGCNKHSAVAMYGSFIIIGCPSYNVNSGIVYVFKRSKRKWVQDDQLTSSDQTWNSYFGNDVAIYGSVLAVGRYGDNTKGYFSGAVHIYKFINGRWTEDTKLTASDAAAYNYFGCSVSLNENYLAVGSKGDDQNGLDSGSTYLYTHSNGAWVEQARLISSDGSSSPHFGTTVRIDGKQIVVGIGRSNLFNSDISVYVYNTDKLSSNLSNHRWRNYTKPHVNISTVNDHSVILHCNDLNMTAYWIRSSFVSDNITATVLDHECKGMLFNATMLWMIILYDRCGTTIKEDSNNIVIRNIVLLEVFKTSNNLITRGIQTYQYNLKCIFPRVLFTTMQSGYNISTTRRKSIFNESSPGNFKASMDMYTSSFFMEKLKYPIEMSLSEPMYVGVKIMKTPNVKLVVQKCYATASPVVDGDESYVFFMDRCPLDKTFQTLVIASDRFYFMIDAFQFIRIKETVFLHCVVLICEKNSFFGNCKQECTHRKRREINNELSPFHNNMQYVTSGQIIHVKEKSCKDIAKYCPEYSVCIELHPAICRCKDMYVFDVSSNTCTKERIVHWENLHLDKNWDNAYLNRSSAKFLQLAHTMEMKLFHVFVEIMEMHDIVGVKVISGSPGSVLLDFSLIYSINASNEVVSKKLIYKLQNNNPIFKRALQSINIVLDTLPTTTRTENLYSVNYKTLIVGVTIATILMITGAVFVYLCKQHKRTKVAVRPVENGFDLKQC